jgi:hypothetical protein
MASNVGNLSDAAWLGLLTKDPKSARFRERWMRDRVIESSPRMFAGDLLHQAERDPARFAALAMNVPNDVPPAYWSSFLHCLRLTSPPDNSQSDWEAATDEQCRSVLEHIGYHCDREVAIPFCICVAARPRCGRSPTILAALCRYATEHPDPEFDGCFMPDNNKDRLDTEAINTVRACAAGTISSVLFEDKNLLAPMVPTLRLLVTDKVACVRAATIAALIPVLNDNRDLAVGLFLQATADTDEEVLRTRYARKFIGYAISTHVDQLRPMIQRMVLSLEPQVSEDGAAWATIAYLFAGSCKDEFEQCVAGTPSQRKGVAHALASNLDDERVASRCSELLPPYFDDVDREVRNTASLARHRDVDLAIDANVGALQKFCLSQALVDDPRSALWMLEALTVDLRTVAEPIFSACDTLTTHAAKNPSGDRWDLGSALESLSTMLLRLYGHTSDADRDLRRKCLDRWDAILRNSRWLTTKVLQSLDES